MRRCFEEVGLMIVRTISSGDENDHYRHNTIYFYSYVRVSLGTGCLGGNRVCINT